jgi:hypothetical protein
VYCVKFNDVDLLQGLAIMYRLSLSLSPLSLYVHMYVYRETKILHAII